MDKRGRKAAVAAYKERKPQWGVFAVRCATSGEVWVGASRHLDTEQNGLWFALRLGSSPFRTLQAAWSRAGEGAMDFEVLERLDESASQLRRPDLLKESAAAWRDELRAQAH